MGRIRYEKVSTTDSTADLRNVADSTDSGLGCSQILGTSLRTLCVICGILALMLTLLTFHMSEKKKSSNQNVQAGGPGGSDTNKAEMKYDWTGELVSTGKGYSGTTAKPSKHPTSSPTTPEPTGKPTPKPTDKPTSKPTVKPKPPTMNPTKLVAEPAECKAFNSWMTDHCNGDLSVLRKTKDSDILVVNTDKGVWHKLNKERQDLAYFSRVDGEGNARILRGNYVCNSTQSARAKEIASRVWIPKTCDEPLSFNDDLTLIPPNFTAIILGNSYINQVAQSFAQRSLLRGELAYVETYGERCVTLTKREDFKEPAQVEQSNGELNEKDNDNLDLFSKQEKADVKLVDTLETTLLPDESDKSKKKGRRLLATAVKSPQKAVKSSPKGQTHQESFTLLSGKYDLQFSYGNRGCPNRVNITEDGKNVESETGAPQLQMYHFKNGARLLNIKNTPWMCLKSREVLRMIEIVLKWSLNPPDQQSKKEKNEKLSKDINKDTKNLAMETGFDMNEVDLFLMNDGNMIQWMVDDLTKDDPYFHDVCLTKQKTTQQYAVMDHNQFRTVMREELKYRNAFIDAPAKYLQFANYDFDFDFVHMITGNAHKYEQNKHPLDEIREKNTNEPIGRYCQSDWPRKDPNYVACLDHLGHQCTPGNPDSYAEVLSVDTYLKHCQPYLPK